MQAPPPPRPIDKARAGADLLAHIAVSRYCDHLPYYRQERILARHGLNLSRASMSGWMGKSGEPLEPLARLQHQRVVDSGYVQIDDEAQRAKMVTP